MSQRFDLSGIARNDTTFDFTITAGVNPVNLTSLTVTAYLKPSAASPDATAAVYTAGSGLTVTSAPAGQFTWFIPATALSIGAPGSLWYRVDLTDVFEHTETAMYGAILLTAA